MPDPNRTPDDPPEFIGIDDNVPDDIVDITPDSVEIIEAKSEERVFALGKPDNRHYRRMMRAQNRRDAKKQKKSPTKKEEKT